MSSGVMEMLAAKEITLDQLVQLRKITANELYERLMQQYEPLAGQEVLSTNLETVCQVSKTTVADWAANGWVSVLRPGERGRYGSPTAYDKRDVIVIRELRRVFNGGRGGRIPGFEIKSRLAS